MDHKAKAFGRADERIIAHFYHGKMDAYFSDSDSDHFHATVLKNIIHSAGYMDKIEREIKKIISKLNRVTRRIITAPLKRLSNERLFELLMEFHQSYAPIFGYGLVNTYDRDLVNSVKQYFIKEFDSGEATRLFTLLTTVTTDTYYEQEKKDILQVAIDWKNNVSLVARTELLKQLVEKYGWLKINYEGETRTQKDFAKMIKEVLRSKTVPEVILEKMRKEKSALRSQQIKLEKTLKIPTLMLRLIHAVRQNANLREWRKPLSVRAVWRERVLLNAIAHRLKVTQKELKFLLPQEIHEALTTGQVDRRAIKERMHECVFDLQKDNYQVLVGKLVQELLATIKQTHNQSLTLVRGMATFPGKVTGVVRVVHVLKDLQQFKRDEVFVGKVTSPDLISVFSKAAAVITDEGGLTSHAAIVSREMKVPCIVGTKLATKVFKTGDRVEVDTERGIVNKVV